MRRILLATLASCATLSTANMPTECRDSYNACLNTCEGSVRSLDPGPPIQPASTPPTGFAPGPQSNTSCVDDCNRQAKACEANAHARIAAPPAKE